MTNGYLTFLDYLELRRRVEKRLTAGHYFLLHTIVFAISATVIGSAAYSPIYYEFRDYFIRPGYGQFVALWSGILLIHGLLSFWRSGARAGKRDMVIENEMRERLQNDDFYLSDQPRDLFRLHSLLNEDIQNRSSLITTLLTFVVINAFIWIPWALSSPSDSFAWTLSLWLIPPFVIAIVWNIIRRGRHDKRIRKQLEAYFVNEHIGDDDSDYEREIRLSNNEELVTVDEYMLKLK